MIRRPRSDRFFAGFTKQVSKEYGVLLERLGAALRGTFLIDPDGVVRAYMVQDLTVGRSVDEILRLVSAPKWLPEDEEITNWTPPVKLVG